MLVELDVTEAQALTLQAMFEEWNYLSNIGATRAVAFLVDGDGDFRPKCEIKFSEDITPLNDTIRNVAKTNNTNCDLFFDYDRVAWNLMNVK